jgi:hypothetical protein
MKHIKTYKVFESSSDEVKQYLNDIFLDLQDKEIEFVVNYTTYWGELDIYKVIIGDKNTNRNLIYSIEPDTKLFYLSDIYDNIQMAKSYMTDEGFSLDNVRIQSPDEDGELRVYGLSAFNEYGQGKGELGEQPITYLELKFSK